MQAFINKVSELWLLAQYALKDVFWGFHPSHFANAFLTADKLSMLQVGLIAVFTTLALIIGVPHLIINAVLLFKDLKRIRSERPLSLRDAFILRQARSQRTYLRNLSEADASGAQAATPRIFSSDETIEVQRAIERAAKKDSLGASRVLGSLLGKTNGGVDSDSRIAANEITGVLSALRHFVFSFASFTNSATAYSHFWNGWFAFRTFLPIFHPILASIVLVYPSFFRVSIARENRSTFPSRVNGGLRVFWRTAGLWLFDRASYAKIRAWEEKVLSVEDLFRKSVARTQGLGRNAIARISDHAIERFLVASGDGSIGRGSFWLSRCDQLKLLHSESTELFMLTDSQIDALVSEVLKEEESGRSSSVLEVFSRLRSRVAEKLDPTLNRQVQIIQITRMQMKNPKAMARAVRSMLASNVVDKPIELFFLFVCYAGVDSGLLKPLQNEMFSSNSWFHLSRYVFVNGFIYSVIAGIFSETWLKVQQDSKNEGKFENVPAGSDAVKPYSFWLFKNMFLNSENSWWQNQKYTVSKYILPTLKATFATAFLVNIITLGRFDLDSFLAQTAALIFLPFTGMSWQFEQGFEMASAWVVRDIPEHLRSHPLAQQYAQRAIAKRRIVFNFYYKIWDHLTWNFLTTFMNMSTTEFGTRSFSRLLLRGFTPVELLVNPLRNLNARYALPVAVEWLILKCDALLTHGYTDGTKLIQKK